MPDQIKLCECNCGRPAPIAPRNDKRRGWVKGQPVRFVRGHANRGKSRPLADRFWEKVDKHGPLPSAEAVARWPEIVSTSCWIFTGRLRWGYGGIQMGGRGCPTAQAHRVAWYLQTGAWPEPNCCHKCDVKACVRFEHLFEGTDADNAADRDAKGRTKYFSKLTAEQVAEIRKLRQPWIRAGRGRRRRGTAMLVKRFAERYGVEERTIRKILRNERWEGMAA